MGTLRRVLGVASVATLAGCRGDAPRVDLETMGPAELAVVATGGDGVSAETGAQ